MIDTKTRKSDLNEPLFFLLFFWGIYGNNLTFIKKEVKLCGKH